ncbi:MAG: hypothetical protein GXO83_00720 [Chlorobi bacterium]|nr:hypothetical protein [Chlorobiota bacterium]
MKRIIFCYWPLTIVFLLLFTSGTLYGQFSLSGELRPRTEYRHGYKSLTDADQDPAFFVSQRSRINFNYLSEKYRVLFSFQDVRTWGSTSQLNVSDDFLSIHQAWGEVFLTPVLSLKVGRQELVYDNHRIFGNVGWTQQARSHDLVLFKYNKPERLQVHLGLAFNQNKEQLASTFYTVPKNYKSMQFLWVRTEGNSVGASFLFLNNGMQFTDTLDRSSVNYSQTLGTYLNVKLGTFKLNLTGYYQGGKDPSGNELSATYFAAGIIKPLDFGLAPAFGFERLSGTGQDASPGSANHSFTPLYGTNHKFNGHMDYFYVGNHINSVGLLDLYLNISYIKGKFRPAVALHYFSSAANVLDNGSPGNYLNRFLGVESDISAGYKLADEVLIKAGYSQMFGSPTLEALRGGDHSLPTNWGWLMISFTPDFL